MRKLAIIAISAATALSGVCDAFAQSGPVIVIPTRRDVPVVLYGRDVSYVVVESDWGLARPGHLAPSIVGYAPPVGNRASPLRGVNYPRYGVAPQRGRYEVEPPPDRHLPEPAESFSRSWGAQSPGVASPRPAHRRPLDPIHPAQPNDAPFGPQSYNAAPPLAVQSQSQRQGADVAPATVVDPQTFMMPPVILNPKIKLN